MTDNVLQSVLVDLTKESERARRRSALDRDERVAEIPVGAQLKSLSVYAGVEYFPRLWGSLVASVTGSWICHVGLIFHFHCDHVAYPVVYEARTVHFAGPIRFEDVYRRWTRPLRGFHIRFLKGVSYESLVQKFLKVDLWAREKKGYDYRSVLKIWAYRRLKLEPPESDETRLMCSEAVARVLYPEYDLRTDEYPTFDSIPPGPLWRRLNRLLEDRVG